VKKLCRVEQNWALAVVCCSTELAGLRAELSEGRKEVEQIWPEIVQSCMVKRIVSRDFGVLF
jgi:tetrahydromethanopterin S-methyltransferase subunit G